MNCLLCISLHLSAVECTHSTFVASDIHPPSSRGRRLLEVCNHQGWGRGGGGGGGGGCVLLFRGENDELAQEAKKKKYQVSVPSELFSSRVSLIVFVADEDHSLSPCLTQRLF